MTGRRGRTLNWDDWVEANGIVNEVLDKLGVSANVKSLGGRFRIRRGFEAVKDWGEREYENVGSVMNPVSRREAWHKEGE
jgi:hypothetical protein